jgi:hypothetical protein
MSFTTLRSPTVVPTVKIDAKANRAASRKKTTKKRVTSTGFRRSTEFRRFYDRGDLPLQVAFDGAQVGASVQVIRVCGVYKRVCAL